MFHETDGSPSIGHVRTRGGTTTTGAAPALTPPDGYRIVALDTPSCTNLQDVASLRWDLESSVLFCDAYLARESGPTPQERSPGDAHWVAALVNYGRAFGTGVRKTERLDPGVLSPGQRERHDYFLNLRNKHVAHAVNKLEHVVCVAYLTDSAFAPRAVTRVGQTHVSLNPMADEDVHDLRDLANTFIVLLNRRVRALHAKIADELEQLGLQAVYALPDVKLTLPSTTDVTRRR